MPVRNRPVYDTIGRGYTVGRVEDPRIAVHIHGALGDAESVLNIGAGSGSYEPRDRRTVVLTVHHWIDRARGLAEMRRVARRRAVLFLRDPTVASHWWLYEYFPATARLVGAQETPLADLAQVLGPLDVQPVPIPADCRDGFEAAYWRRPHASWIPRCASRCLHSP